MPSQIIQSYLDNESIPKENRRALFNDLQSGEYSESDIEDGLKNTVFKSSPMVTQTLETFGEAKRAKEEGELEGVPTYDVKETTDFAHAIPRGYAKGKELEDERIKRMDELIAQTNDPNEKAYYESLKSTNFPLKGAIMEPIETAFGKAIDVGANFPIIKNPVLDPTSFINPDTGEFRVPITTIKQELLKAKDFIGEQLTPDAKKYATTQVEKVANWIDNLPPDIKQQAGEMLYNTNFFMDVLGLSDIGGIAKKSATELTEQVGKNLTTKGGNKLGTLIPEAEKTATAILQHNTADVQAAIKGKYSLPEAKAVVDAVGKSKVPINTYDDLKTVLEDEAKAAIEKAAPLRAPYKDLPATDDFLKPLRELKADLSKEPELADKLAKVDDMIKLEEEWFANTKPTYGDLQSRKEVLYKRFKGIFETPDGKLAQNITKDMIDKLAEGLRVNVESSIPDAALRNQLIQSNRTYGELQGAIDDITKQMAKSQKVLPETGLSKVVSKVPIVKSIANTIKMKGLPIEALSQILSKTTEEKLPSYINQIRKAYNATRSPLPISKVK
jgi:hypothetical protein